MDIADPLRRFSDDDLRLVEQISLQIATAIEVARNFELAENRASRERMASEMTTRIREKLDVTSVLQTAVNEFYANLGLDEASVYLIPPTSDGEPASSASEGPLSEGPLSEGSLPQPGAPSVQATSDSESGHA